MSETSLEPPLRPVPGSRAERRRRRQRQRRRAVAAVVLCVVALSCALGAVALHIRSVQAAAAAAQVSSTYQGFLACQGVSGDIKAAANDLRAAGEGLKPLAETSQSLSNLDVTLDVVSSATALDPATRSAYSALRMSLAQARSTFDGSGAAGVESMVGTLDRMLAQDDQLCVESVG